MIEALKSDAIVEKMGGRFKLCALIQRRLKELIIDGAPLLAAPPVHEMVSPGFTVFLVQPYPLR